jgi:8-oxo-dGTP pyrophosphatase MutT (NUDIX family)
MLYKTKPKDFSSSVDVVGCFCEHDGKLLLLLRQDSKSQGNRWALPAGKKEKSETLIKAMIREMGEETGRKVNPSELRYFRKVYVRFPEYDFYYHMFHTPWTDENVTTAIKEHKNHAWVTPQTALKMDLIQDLATCIKMFYKL